MIRFTVKEMPPKRKATSAAPSEPFHMSTRKRVKTAESAQPAEAAPLTPSLVPSPGPSQDDSASRGRIGRPARRGRGGARGGVSGEASVRTSARIGTRGGARSDARGGARGGARGSGRGRGGRAWRDWGGGSRKPERHGGEASDFADKLALQYVDPEEKEEPPREWIDPKRDTLETRMEGLSEAYKEVFAALKPALAELVDRAQAKLKADQDSYKQNVHYAKLKADLDKNLQQEIELIQAKGKLTLEQEERRVRAEIASIEVNTRV